MFVNVNLAQPIYILGDGVVALEYQQYLLNESINTQLVSHNDFLSLPAKSQCMLGFHNIDYKRRWVSELSHLNLNWLTYIHPTAIVLGKVGAGSCIGAFVHIGYNASCGQFTTACEHSVIGHDTNIGSYCFLGAGTVLGGGSQVGSNVYFGIRNAVRDKILITDNCFFAIGTTVRKNVINSGKYYGRGISLQKF